MGFFFCAFRPITILRDRPAAGAVPKKSHDKECIRMKELTLDELKQIELETLKMFHAFCVENNIRYYLAYGTLLGAVRYKKFIPWDDDVDLLIPREDYDRLITLFKDNERYRLYSFERNKDYHFPFAKLCDMTTLKVEDFYPNAKVKLGVEIDLFPLDNFNSDYDKAVQEAEHIHYPQRPYLRARP